MIKDALAKLLRHDDLSRQESAQAFRTILAGESTPAQIGALLTALRMKGETVEEIVGAAQEMRAASTQVRTNHPDLIDTCGTGGDGAKTFNISTTVAFVIAGAGAKVAKHGNRSVSSKSGSADVLEAAGIRLDLQPEKVASCIDEIGIGFLFAPSHHPAMRHAIGPRKELGIRTIFNLLGPLTNPANAKRQVIGVYSAHLLTLFAEVLKELGSERAIIVHGDDGMDEITITAGSEIAFLDKGQVHRDRITPEDFGLKRQPCEALRVEGVADSLAKMRKVLAGEEGAERDIVLLNAAAALYVAGLDQNLKDGFAQAKQAIDSGQAQEKLEQLAVKTQTLAEETP